MSHIKSDARATAQSAIEAEYLRRTPKSRTFTERAMPVLPGGETCSGVITPLLAHHRPWQGARCRGIDGNVCRDVANTYTRLIHGHAFQPIVQAVQQAVTKGSTWTAKAVQ